MPTDHSPDLSETMFDLLGGFATSQIVSAAARLDIPAVLAPGPCSVDELAAATGTQPGPLRRLVQAWHLLGLVRRDDDGRYGATSLLALLGSVGPQSLAGMARLYGHEYYRAWSELLHTVRTGRSGFEHHHGTTLWNHLARDAPAALAFAQAMAFNVRRDVPPILEAYEFSAARRVVDVGCASGELLAAILARHPGVRGVAFDLPRVAAQSGTVFAERGLADRVEVVTGSFFETVPPGGDLYLLKAVLHNWDDERAVQILARCHAAMAPGSRLLIIESPGPEAETGELRSVMKDLWMMVLFGAGDRTVTGYLQLATAAGFTQVDVVPGARHPTIIEATR